MTFSAPYQHASVNDGRVLLLSEWPQALALAQQDPVSYILAITHIERGIHQGVHAGELWGFPAVGPLEAACWMGANLIPIVPRSKDNPQLTREALSAFALMATSAPKRSSSIVGPRNLVLALWDFLEPFWRMPREIRASQPSMIIEGQPKIDPDPFVRLTRWDEFDVLLPASVHMFIEEVGISPLTFGSAQYSMRVRELIADQRTLMRMSSTIPQGNVLADHAEVASSKNLPLRDTVAFKADFGAVIAQAAQVQGVWVNPQFRGQGLAAPAMASVVEYGLTNLAPMVSLYVNDYNVKAISTYRRVGFEQVGEYATVLF